MALGFLNHQPVGYPLNSTSSNPSRKSSVKTSRTHFLFKKNLDVLDQIFVMFHRFYAWKAEEFPEWEPRKPTKTHNFTLNWPHSFILRMERKITHHLRNALRKAKKKQEAFLALRLLGHLNGTCNSTASKPTNLMAQTSPRPTTGWMVQFTTCKSWGETTINHFEVDSWNPIIYKVCFSTIQPVLGPWDLTSPSNQPFRHVSHPSFSLAQVTIPEANKCPAWSFGNHWWANW